MTRLRRASLEEVLRYGGRLPKGLVAPIAGAAGPVLDHLLGVAGTPPAATLTVNIGNAVPVGELVVVGGASATVTSPITVTDTQSNVWTDVSPNPAHSMGGSLFASNLRTALTTASRVTVSAGSSARLAGVAASYTGIIPGAATAAYAGQTATGTGTSATVTSGSVQVGDLIVAIASTTVGSFTVPGSPWHTATNASTDPAICMCWRVATATAAVTFTATAGGANSWVASIAAFPSGGQTHGLTMLV